MPLLLVSGTVQTAFLYSFMWNGDCDGDGGGGRDDDDDDPHRHYYYYLVI